MPSEYRKIKRLFHRPQHGVSPHAPRRRARTGRVAGDGQPALLGLRGGDCCKLLWGTALRAWGKEGENRIGRRASHHEECEVLGSLLLPCAVTRVSLLAVWCLLGATPRGQPWTSTVTLPQGRNGLRAWWMAVLSTFRELSMLPSASRITAQHVARC